MVASRARKRDAHATFAGFVFQVNVTILRWLHLQPGQHLELEAGEDIDLIQAAAAKGLEGAHLLEQVKQLRGKRLTLRSTDALEAIANFCQHRSSRTGEKLSFRFLSTTSPSKERQWSGRDNGIVTWEKVRNGKYTGGRAEVCDQRDQSLPQELRRQSAEGRAQTVRRSRLGR